MLTCYCKKCNRDVPVGDRCPQCGAKLSPAQAHAAWAVDHTPVRDWLCWNGAMRFILPIGGLALAVSVALEAVMGGAAGVEELLRHGLVGTVLTLVLLVSAVLFLILLAQGEDIMDCVVDSRGVHVSVFLPGPTPLKLLARFRSPALMKTLSADDPAPELLISEQHLSWQEVSRVQFWPEKRLMLFYAPRHWLRLSLPCTPNGWEDACGFLLSRLGKRKDVILPPVLRPEAEAKGSGKATGKKAAGKRRKPGSGGRKPVPGSGVSADLLTDIRAMNAELEKQDRQEAAG